MLKMRLLMNIQVSNGVAAEIGQSHGGGRAILKSSRWKSNVMHYWACW